MSSRLIDGPRRPPARRTSATICRFSSWTRAMSSSVSRPSSTIARAKAFSASNAVSPSAALASRSAPVRAECDRQRAGRGVPGDHPVQGRPDLRPRSAAGSRRSGDQRFQVRRDPRRRRDQDQRPRHRPVLVVADGVLERPDQLGVGRRRVRCPATGAGRAAPPRSAWSARRPRSAPRAGCGCPGCRAGRAPRTRSPSTRCRPAAPAPPGCDCRPPRRSRPAARDSSAVWMRQQREPGPDQPAQVRREVVGHVCILLSWRRSVGGHARRAVETRSPDEPARHRLLYEHRVARAGTLTGLQRW